MTTAPLFLAPDERKKFADWLEQEAETDAKLHQQLSAINGGRGHRALAAKYHVESMAARVIADKLRAVEDAMVGG